MKTALYLRTVLRRYTGAEPFFVTVSNYYREWQSGGLLIYFLLTLYE